MSRSPIYKVEEVRAAMDCAEILKRYGYTIKNNRCAAKWRGGTNPESVALKGPEYYDHGAEEGGDCIKLIGLLDRQYGVFPIALRHLGDLAGCMPKGYLPPSPATGPSKYDHLLGEGYTETNRYDYTDEAGELVQQVVRLEHATKGKQFLQCDANQRWSIKHIEPVLYNLPAVSASDWAIVVEGEKDADTLIAWDLPATTNAGGAKRWLDSFSDSLAGKDVVLMPDNDPAGIAHLDLVGKSLQGKARSIRVLTPSKLPKGDVTDWKESEGGTRKQLNDLIKSAQAWIEPRADEMALAAAKEANEEPFRNYLPEKQTEGNKTTVVKVPRLINGLIKDAHLRFLGFPRKIGDILFDHDRESGKIEYIEKTASLFSWMGLKSCTRIAWGKGDDLVTKEEFFAGLLARARSYESISRVPDWPRRDDVYYSHPALPDPDPNHKYFEGMMAFFAPASPEFDIILRAFFMAPMFFLPGIPKPIFVFDSEDGAGTGKSTAVEAGSFLYDCPPIVVQRKTLSRDFEEVIKRILSPTGRLVRILTVDNVTGNFRSDELSSMVTQSHITGRPAYGKGETSRPNNLTYTITANSASIDNDIAIRSYMVFLKKINVNAQWRQRLWDYITRYRPYIFADMIDLLSNHEPFDMPTRTRFPEFETQILAANCKDEEELTRVLEVMDKVREEANKEGEIADHIKEIVRDKLIDSGVEFPFHRDVFIATAVLEGWLKNQIPDMPNISVQAVRNMVKNELLEGFDPQVKRYPSNGSNRRSGVMWRPGETTLPSIIISGTPNSPNVEIG